MNFIDNIYRSCNRSYKYKEIMRLRNIMQDKLSRYSVIYTTKPCKKKPYAICYRNTPIEYFSTIEEACLKYFIYRSAYIKHCIIDIQKAVYAIKA